LLGRTHAIKIPLLREFEGQSPLKGISSVSFVIREKEKAGHGLLQAWPPNPLFQAG
jgi:hypothetical protein